MAGLGRHVEMYRFCAFVECHLAAQVGLSYVCATAERFFAVSTVLNNMVLALPEQQSVRLLKHIIRHGPPRIHLIRQN